MSLEIIGIILFVVFAPIYSWLLFSKKKLVDFRYFLNSTWVGLVIGAFIGTILTNELIFWLAVGYVGGIIVGLLLSQMVKKRNAPQKEER